MHGEILKTVESGVGLRVNIGCGRSPTEGFLNFDNSWSLRLSRFPILIFFGTQFNLFSNNQIENLQWNRIHNVSYLDATKPLPFAADTVEVIYTSHMLEHVTRGAAFEFMRECNRVLMPNGVLRISVPDLRKLVEAYLHHGSGDRLMEDLFVASPPISSLLDKIRLVLVGYRHHQWMYDADSLIKCLKAAGFNAVFRLPAGDTLIPDSQSLDLYERFEQSLYVEAVKQS